MTRTEETLRVYEGEISVTFGDQNIVARKGKEVAVGDGLQATNFDPKDTDPFYRWAERRSEYIATANVSAARQAGSMGLLASTGSWAYNPYYGMFTYLPSVGYGYSPFGWAYYSPLTVGNYYAYNYGNYGGYYNNVGTGTRVSSTHKLRSPRISEAWTRSSSRRPSIRECRGKISGSLTGLACSGGVASHAAGGGGGHK